MQNKVPQGLIFVEYAKNTFCFKIPLCGFPYLFYAVLIDFFRFLWNNICIKL